MQERERTSTELIMYASYLYFLGLSFRNTAKAIEPFVVEGGRSHVAIWYWGYSNSIQSSSIHVKKSGSIFLVDETQVQIGSYPAAWLWIAIEPIHRVVQGVSISRHRNMLVAEEFLRSLVELYGENIRYIQMVEAGIMMHVGQLG